MLRQVAPVLQQGTNSSSAYFPQGRWYSLYNHSLVDASSGGMTQTVQVRHLLCSPLMCI
jgi:alpha-glucosidase (family GH31 glycosyl hydrolase)